MSSKGLNRVTSTERGFKKKVGKVQSASGKLVPKQFYLGHNKQAAAILGLVIQTEWRRLVGVGQRVWDQSTLAKIEEEKVRLLGAPDRLVHLPNRPTTRQPAYGQPVHLGSLEPQHVYLGRQDDSLYQTMDAFVSSIKLDPKRSPSWKVALQQRVMKLKEAILDRPMSATRYDDVVLVVNHFAALPKGKKGEKISVETAMNHIMAARQFFSWADKTDRWLAPRHLDSIFDIDRRALERHAGVITTGKVLTFTIPELTAIWKYIGTIQPSYQDRRRLLMLLALQTGMTQHEIAQMTKAELDLSAGILERRRWKTGVLGQWILWPETISLLRTEMDRDPGQPLALLTDEGTPLVRYSATGKTDSVGLSWHRMVTKVEVRPLGFKYLRKTGSDLVRQVGGIEMAEAFLSHAERTVSRVYNNRDFAKLGVVLGEVRKMVQPMFD